jgi:hypothetical protein
MYLEIKMGDVIDFRKKNDSVRLNPPSEGTAEIITFTGGGHRRKNIQPGLRAVGLRMPRSMASLWTWVSASFRRPPVPGDNTGNSYDFRPGEARRHIFLKWDHMDGMADGRSSSWA